MPIDQALGGHGFLHRWQVQVLDELHGVAVVVAPDQVHLEASLGPEPGLKGPRRGTLRLDLVMEEVAEERQPTGAETRDESIDALQLSPRRPRRHGPPGPPKGGRLTDVDIREEQLMPRRPVGRALGTQHQVGSAELDLEVRHGCAPRAWSLSAICRTRSSQDSDEVRGEALTKWG